MGVPHLLVLFSTPPQPLSPFLYSSLPIPSCTSLAPGLPIQLYLAYRLLLLLPH